MVYIVIVNTKYLENSALRLETAYHYPAPENAHSVHVIAIKSYQVPRRHIPLITHTQPRATEERCDSGLSEPVYQVKMTSDRE